MKLLICGSRSITDFNRLVHALQLVEGEITSIISGGARGVDQLAEVYALRKNLPIEIIYPDWDTYGRSAGIRRNLLLLDKAEAVLALWDQASPGTKHTITEAKRRGLPTWVYTL